MASMQDLINAVAAEKQVTLGVIALLTDLHSRLAAASKADDMSAVDQVVADLQANTASLANAVAANTVVATSEPLADTNTNPSGSEPPASP